jgi:hypothetical protein
MGRPDDVSFLRNLAELVAMVHPSWVVRTAARTRITRGGLGSLAVAVILGVSGLAHAQAWTRPKGEALFLTSFGWITASEQFTFDGRTTDFIDGLQKNTFSDASFYLHTETGITDDITLVMDLPYKRLFIEDLAFNYSTQAFGDFRLAGRFSLLPIFDLKGTSWAMAIETGLKIPLGYTRNLQPSVGAGQLDWDMKAAVGYSIPAIFSYVQTHAGLRLRTRFFGFSSAKDCNVGQDIDCFEDVQPTFGDELLYYFEYGLNPLPSGAVIAFLKLDGLYSILRPDVGFTATNPIPTRQRFMKLGGGIATYPFRFFNLNDLRDLGLTVQYFRTVTGLNTIKSQELFISIDFRETFF